jgi:hypothetical protein
MDKWFGIMVYQTVTMSHPIDGRWNGGDFENGIWYSGVSRKNATSRFGTMAIIAEPQFGSQTMVLVVSTLE